MQKEKSILYLVIKQNQKIDKNGLIVYIEDFINLATPYKEEVKDFLNIESDNTLKSIIKRNSVVKDKYNNYYKIEKIEEEEEEEE